MSNMVVNTNIRAMNSHRSVKNTGNTQSTASERLSTGLRINKAADDAAGLAISEKMRSQIRGLDQASANAQDGINLIQTAEGALQSTENMLQRMRELVVQASNDTLQQEDRDKIALELDQLTDEISKTAEKTEYNKKKLIDGSWESSELYLQTGANSTQGLSFNIAGMSDVSLGVTTGQIGDVVRGQESSTFDIENAAVGSKTTTISKDALNSMGITDGKIAAYDVKALNDLEIGNGTPFPGTLSIDSDGNVSVGTGTITATDGTAFSAGTNYTVEDLAGKVIADSTSGKTWVFSDDGRSVTEYDLSKTSTAVTSIEGSIGTQEYAGVTFTGDATSVSASVDLYDATGISVSAGTGLTAGTTYYTADGKSSFTLGGVTNNGTAATDGDSITFSSVASGTEAQIATKMETLSIDSKGTVSFSANMTSLDGTEFIKGKAYTLEDLKGQTFVDEAAQKAWSFSGSGNSVTEYDLSVTHEDNVTAASVGTYNYSGVNLTVGTTDIKADVDLYTADGTKVDKGTALDAKTTYYTADGKSALSMSSTSAGSTSVDITHTMATSDTTKTLTVAEVTTKTNSELGQYAGNYGGITIDSDGMISGTAYNGTTKIDVSDVNARKGLTFATNNGTIAFSADGKSVSVDTSAKASVTNATVPTNTYDASAFNGLKITDSGTTTYNKQDFNDMGIGTGASSFSIASDGKISTSSAIIATDGTIFSSTATKTYTLADLAGKTFVDTANSVAYTFSDNGKEVTAHDFSNAVSTTPGTALSAALFDATGSSSGTSAYSGVNFTANTTSVTVDVDLYLTDGTKVGAGTALQANTLYMNEAGDKSFYLEQSTSGAATYNAELLSGTLNSTSRSLATVTTGTGKMTMGSDGTITVNANMQALDGTALTAGKSYSLDDLKGLTFIDTTSNKSWTFSDDGESITTYNLSATKAETDPLASGSKVYSGVEFIAGTAKTGPTASVDLFEADGTKLSAGSALVADTTYYTADGQSSFSISSSDNTAKFTHTSVSTGTKTTAVSNTTNADLAAFQGTYNGITISEKGQISGVAVSTDDKTVDLSNVNARKGQSFLTDNGLITFSEDGKSVSIDANITTATGMPAEGDTSGMNSIAKTADDAFNKAYTKLMEENPDASHGTVISLLTDKIDAAIEIVSSQRAQLGAYQNRLDYTISNLDVASENLSSSESRIRDTDMAKEMMKYTQSNVLQQAGISMLAQANQSTQNILQLLG